MAVAAGDQTRDSRLGMTRLSEGPFGVRSSIPSIAEPFFTNLNASVEFSPAMTKTRARSIIADSNAPTRVAYPAGRMGWCAGPCVALITVGVVALGLVVFLAWSDSRTD